MLRPMGSPVRLDFIQWLLTFHAWLPGWPPSLVLKFLIEFNTLILLCSHMKLMKSCSFLLLVIYLLARKLKVKSRCMRIVNLGELVLYMKAFFYIYDSITSEISGNFALGSCRFPPRIDVQKRFKVSNGSRGRITG